MNVKSEKSCGGVVFTKENGNIRYVIIRSHAGTYGFPKGHVEGNETEQETALREIKEETGLSVSLLPGFSRTVSYILPGRGNIRKQVVYFVAEYSGQRIRFLPSELDGAWLVTFDKAVKLLQFDSLKELLAEADRFIRSVR